MVDVLQLVARHDFGGVLEDATRDALLARVAAHVEEGELNGKQVSYHKSQALNPMAKPPRSGRYCINLDFVTQDAEHNV